MLGQNFQKFNLGARACGAKIQEGPQGPRYATAVNGGAVLVTVSIKPSTVVRYSHSFPQYYLIIILEQGKIISISQSQGRFCSSTLLVIIVQYLSTVHQIYTLWSLLLKKNSL